MKTNTRLYSVLNCTVHVSVCRRFVCQRFWSVDVLVFRRFGLVWFVDVLVFRCFGLSTFWSVDALVCWCFGMSTFWFVAALVLVCRYFGMSVFRFVDVLAVDDSVCRRFDQLPTNGSTLTHQILFINIIIILQTTYQNGFLQWHFSQSRSPWVLLLKYNLHFTLHRLYIVNIFPTFKHFNPSFSSLMPRIKYCTCYSWIDALALRNHPCCA